MRKLVVILVGLLALSVWSVSQAAEAQQKIKVLLVTGDDVAPAHNWREISKATRDVLEASGKFEVKVSEEAAVLESASALERYDLVFLAMYNRSVPTLSDTAKENLLNFVKGGKGFAVSHLASASFNEWAEFKKLCGRNWIMGVSGHGPRSVFKAKMTNNEHPITKGLEDFDVDDELYAKLQGDTPINVLVEAYSDWSKKTEPLVFTLQYGKGRVFHETFGHDAKAVMTSSVQKIIARGCEWAATGKAE